MWIAIDDDGGHIELAQSRAQSDAALPPTNNDHVWLGGVAELLRFRMALTKPRLPIRDSAVRGSHRSPITLRLLVTLELVQRRQQCPGFAVPEPEMTYTPADRGLELDPAFGFAAGLAQLVSDGETAGLDSIERLTQHLAYAFCALNGDDVPGECDKVAPEAVINEKAGSRINVPGGEGPLEVRQPPCHDGSCSRCVEWSLRGGLGHRCTPRSGVGGFG